MHYLVLCGTKNVMPQTLSFPGVSTCCLLQDVDCNILNDDVYTCITYYFSFIIPLLILVLYFYYLYSIFSTIYKKLPPQ